MAIIARTDMATLPQQAADGATGTGRRQSLVEARALLRLAAPIMMIALVNMAMSVTDTLMVSMLYGAEALAAVAVGSDLYSIVFYICAGTLGGVAPFYASAAARGDAADCLRLHRIGRAVALLLAVVAVPLVWFAPDWLKPVGLAPDLLEQGRDFTQAMALTLLPMLGVTLYRTILTAAERPQAFLKVTLAMLPLNAIGNYVLMQGLGPIPPLGPTGSGVATLLVAGGTLIALMVMARRDAAPPAATAAVFDWRGLLTVLRVGLPIGVMAATETGIFLAVTLYAATLTAADVAAHTLTLRVAGIAYAGSFALQQAAMVRMARALGLDDAGGARAVTGASLWLAAIGGLVLVLLLAIGAAPLALWFFGPDVAGAKAIQVATGLLMLLGLLQFVAYPGLAALGLLRGRTDTRLPMLFKLVAYWLIGAPLGIWLCEMQSLGVTGLWIGLVAGAALTTLLALVRLRMQR